MSAHSSSTLIKVGCQTNAWPIDPIHPETLYESLSAIHRLRFEGFETGFRNVLPLAEQKSDFQRHQQGLTFFGVHIFLFQYDPETRTAPYELAQKVASVGAEMGAQHLIVSGASCAHNGTAQNGILDRQAAKRKAEALNRIGMEAKKQRLKLAYHNHGPEVSTQPPEIETLLSDTDPALVWLLLDAGHAFRAGADIPAFIERHQERLAGVHLRDFKNGKQVPLGEGGFPLAQVAASLRKTNWAGWVLAEEEREDGSKPGNAAAAAARAALKEAFGV